MQSRIPFMTLVSAAAILGSSACAAILGSSATPTPSPGRLETGEITSQALADNLLGDPATRKFDVYLPPGYDTSKERYPVVYVLHWFTGTYITYAGSTSASMEALIGDGKAKPMILVFPDGYNKLGGSFYRSSPTIGDYETYITRDLVQQIDGTYRTMPGPESRGIMGCSMGGIGAIHLAFKYPGVFGVAAPMSPTAYDFLHEPQWEAVRASFSEPQNMDELWAPAQGAPPFIAIAAATAPNPAKPPFYLDMPFKVVAGKAQIVPEVFNKMSAVDPMSDVAPYLAQPLRLHGLLVYNDTRNGDSPLEAAFELDAARRFDKTLTKLGIGHEYAEVNAAHCQFDFSPILEFMGAHLTY